MRARLVVIVASSFLGMLLLPAGALAGTYSWDMPANFTSNSPGLNPDNDPYGALPWGYFEGSTRLPRFTTTGLGVSGLSGWTDSTDPPFIGVGSGTDIVDTFSANQLYMTPSASTPVALGWTSPVSHTVNVTVTGSVTATDPNLCLGSFVPSLDLNGSPLGTIDPLTGAITAPSTPVAPGGTIHLTIARPLNYNADCATATVTLHIEAQETIPPPITLSSPANNSVISGGQPTFSGTASAGFGASNQVTVRIYSGSSVSGSPLQTLTTTLAANGAYSAAPNVALADGTYTAQAEQDDVSSPPDAGFSNATTFSIEDNGSSISLDSLGTKPLTTATPTFTGAAGTGPVDSNSVTVVIFSGAGTNGRVVRSVTGAVGSGGHYSVQVSPGLPDGQYTAVAEQSSGAGQAVSAPMSFQIRIGAPEVTLVQPADGSTTIAPSPTFSGTADAGLGVSPTVTVVLHKGSSASGTPLGTVSVTEKGGVWTAGWPTNLPLGTYTAVAKQTDVLGRTGFSAAHTFQIIPGPAVVGSAIGLSKGRVASVSITCYALSGQSCAGDVMMLTVRNFTPVSGGPSGQLRLMFDYVKLAPGTTTTLKQTVSPQVYAQLRHAKTVNVRVSAMFGQSGGSGTSSSSVRTLHT